MLPDGATRYLSLNVDPVYDTENRITGAVTVLQDITDAHEAQESMSRLAAIVESSDDAIISKTLEGIVTSWNDSAERIFGYTADEMIGQSITRLIPDDRLDEEKHILARLRNGERIDHFQTRRVTKAGKLLDISLTISPLKDANGRIIGASKVARDITRLKETERNTAMLAAIVHTSQDAIVSKTLEGIVTSWNDSAERIFGYTSDEMIGQSITRIIPQDRQEEEPMILERLKRGEQVNHFQTKRLTKTGKLIDISLSISPIYDPSGVVIGASKIARPLTGGEKLAKNERNYNMLGL
jgi:PAS domain S-box-containing protein